VWFSSGALPALSHILSAARVVCWPCLVASELKLAFAVLIDSLGTSPILLLLLLLHRDHRDRATALQADEQADHDHYPPHSDVCAPTLHRSNLHSALHLLLPHRDLQTDEERKHNRVPTAFWCVRYQAIPIQLGCTFFRIEIFPPSKLTNRRQTPSPSGVEATELHRSSYVAPSSFAWRSVPSCELTKRRTTTAEPTAFWFVRFQATSIRRGCTSFSAARSGGCPCKLTKR
jgi:hypothetical protein